jgi:hypothetical protein
MEFVSFTTEPPLELPAPVRVKLIDPVVSSGPSAAAELLELSDTHMSVRLGKAIVVGAMLQIRNGTRLARGRAVECAAAPPGYAVRLKIERD